MWHIFGNKKNGNPQKVVETSQISRHIFSIVALIIITSSFVIQLFPSNAMAASTQDKFSWINYNQEIQGLNEADPTIKDIYENFEEDRTLAKNNGANAFALIGSEKICAYGKNDPDDDGANKLATGVRLSKDNMQESLGILGGTNPEYFIDMDDLRNHQHDKPITASFYKISKGNSFIDPDPEPGQVPTQHYCKLSSPGTITIKAKGWDKSYYEYISSYQIQSLIGSDGTQTKTNDLKYNLKSKKDDAAFYNDDLIKNNTRPGALVYTAKKIKEKVAGIPGWTCTYWISIQSSDPENGFLHKFKGDASGNECITDGPPIPIRIEQTAKFVAEKAEKALRSDIPSDDPTDGADSATTCAIDTIGWIICPVVNFMAKIADASYGFLSNNFLTVKPALFGSDGSPTDNPTYAAWSIMRNFANVAFVIAFLIIIFSQLTGAGVTNYGVKKLLPRIIIAAILVNLSYFICQIGVDLSNILGKSLSGLFTNIGLPGGENVRATGFWSNGGGWAGLAGTILATAVVGAAVWSSLSALIPILILAFFGLVMILFLLTARQALIVLLTVISPLAFVAFLLPNTEKWYKSWQKMFVGLLMLYPIVALVYGVSGFASRILAGTMQGMLGQIAAASVVVLPLFVIPSLLKKSLDKVGNLGQTLNNLGQRGGKATGARASKAYDRSSLGQFQKYRAGEADKRRGQIQTGTYNGKGGGWNPRNWGSKVHRKFNSSANFNKATGGFGADRELQRGATDRKEQQDIIDQFGGSENVASSIVQAGTKKGTKRYNDARNALEQHGSAGELELFDKIVASNALKRATTHLAAGEYLTKEHKGTTEDAKLALENATGAGASTTDVTAAFGHYVSAARSGRADVLKSLSDYGSSDRAEGTTDSEGRVVTVSMPRFGSHPMTLEKAFSEVPAGSNSRKTFSNDNLSDWIDHRQPNGIAVSQPTSGTAYRSGYEAFLRGDRSHTEAALKKWSTMDTREQNSVKDGIVAAAQAHADAKQAEAVSKFGLGEGPEPPDRPPTFTSPEEAKTYFGIT